MSQCVAVATPTILASFGTLSENVHGTKVGEEVLQIFSFVDVLSRRVIMYCEMKIHVPFVQAKVSQL